jgi:hypothetical protein
MPHYDYLMSSPYMSCSSGARLEMTRMSYFIPYFVNERQSDVRGIKGGWYTMDERGKLLSGPYSCASECLAGCQPATASIPVWLH